MSTEVLSYFLKNSNRKLRLAFQVVLQCAPFLKGLKVSCLITVDAALCGEIAGLFYGMNISYHVLSSSEGKCLVLFYRPEELEDYLEKPEICPLVCEYGYSGINLEQKLERLAGRVRDFACKDMGFPHEIGIFLGYPGEDVKGFIENKGKSYLLIGYWKVYGDPAEAKMIFNEYDRAKDCAVKEFLTGKSVREIALG